MSLVIFHFEWNCVIMTYPLIIWLTVSTYPLLSFNSPAPFATHYSFCLKKRNSKFNSKWMTAIKLFILFTDKHILNHAAWFIHHGPRLFVRWPLSGRAAAAAVEYKTTATTTTATIKWNKTKQFQIINKTQCVHSKWHTEMESSPRNTMAGIWLLLFLTIFHSFVVVAVCVCASQRCHICCAHAVLPKYNFFIFFCFVLVLFSTIFWRWKVFFFPFISLGLFQIQHAVMA